MSINAEHQTNHISENSFNSTRNAC